MKQQRYVVSTRMRQRLICYEQIWIRPIKIRRVSINMRRRVLPISFILVFGAAASTTAQTMKFDPIRINCGGPRYIDPDTKFVWKGDSSVYFTKSYQTSKCNNGALTIANTTKSMRQIYCSYRFFKPRADLQQSYYSIPVLNTTASYIVRLHFAEIVSSHANKISYMYRNIHLTLVLFW